jgi:hypothetical protein
LFGRPLDLLHFVRIAIAIPLAAALRRVHERGLKNIKPADILVDAASGSDG